MPEWVLKFITAITTIKTALKLLLTVVLIVISWPIVNSFLEINGIPDNIGDFLLSLSCFSVAVIAIDIAYVLFGRINKIYQNWKVTRDYNLDKLRNQELEEAKKYEEDEAFRSKVNLTFPHLDKASQKLLRELFEKENMALVWNENPTYELHKKHFMRHIGDANGKKKIYELNPILKEYLSNEKESNITELSRHLDEDCKQFLRIFFDGIPPFGVSEQEMWMDSLVYISHEKMVPLKAVKKTDYTFNLSSDFKSKLISDGHFNTCHRTEVTLDPSRIAAYIPTKFGPKKLS